MLDFAGLGHSQSNIRLVREPPPVSHTLLQLCSSWNKAQQSPHVHDILGLASVIHVYHLTYYSQ